jgi:hypothetical protein
MMEEKNVPEELVVAMETLLRGYKDAVEIGLSGVEITLDVKDGKKTIIVDSLSDDSDFSEVEFGGGYCRVLLRDGVSYELKERDLYKNGELLVVGAILSDQFFVDTVEVGN